MIRKAFVMYLHSGFEEEYERRHNPILPDLEQVLKTHGVSNYSIFLHPDTNQLFGYAEIEDEEQWSAIADTPICKEWWSYMKNLMAVNNDNSPQSLSIREVFHMA